MTRRPDALAPASFLARFFLACRFALVALVTASVAACGGGGDGGGDDGGGSNCGPTLAATTVTVSGRISYERVPFSADSNQGLDYAAITEKPARAVVVEVLSTADQAVLAGTMTDANGQYTLVVPSNRTVIVRAQAQTRQVSPGWNVRVVNNTTNGLYVLDSSSFCTDSATVSKNLLADSGWPDFGGNTYSGTRASAPFAILDSIYSAVQFLRDNGGGTEFHLPALTVFWSVDNRTSDVWNPSQGAILTGTQYTSGPIDGFPGGIYVLGQEGVDTDEFDEHVIVHEFQHFLEDAISRTDSPSGPHSLNQRLDMRLAFAEGFANAYSAMVLDEPLYRDSYGTRQGESFSVDFESNVYAPAGWFNEGSVQSLIWDLYDATPDGSDAVSLGFAPMLAALEEEVRSGTPLTSLYAFVAALKADAGAPVAAIDALLASQQVFGTDAFGAGETNFGNVTEADPVYTELTVGGEVRRVCGTVQAGTYNNLGNRLFLKFSLASAGSVTIRAEYTAIGSQTVGPTPDPDIILYRGGFLAAAETTQAGTESLTRSLEAGDYVIEVYEYSHVDLTENVPRRGVTCMNLSVS